MRRKQIETDGLRISYYESTGKGRPVLFLHGNSLSGLCFTKQLESPLGERFRCIAPDLPGHGRSAPAADPRKTCTLPGYAALLSAFAQALAIEDALLVGWSLGGHILLEADALFPHAAGVLLFGTPPVGKPVAADAFLPNPVTALLLKSTLDTAETAALAAAFVLPGSPIPAQFVDDIERTDGRAREALAQSLHEGRYADEVAIVSGCTRPLAILHGEHDSLIHRAYLEGLTIPALWRSCLQIIPGAGHAPHWEQPEEFNRVLSDFIGECTGSIA